MKIYDKIVIEMASGKVIEQMSYEYTGPVALCDGPGPDGPGGSLGPPGTPGFAGMDSSPTSGGAGGSGGSVSGREGGGPSERKSGRRSIKGKVVKAGGKGASSGEKEENNFWEIEPWEYDIETYEDELNYLQGLLDAINSGQEATTPERTAKIKELLHTLQQMTPNELARQMSPSHADGRVSADDIFLSGKEREMLDEIEANRVTMLTDAINEKVFEMQQTQISNLVSRGVLQSDVGAEGLAKISDYATKGITQGTLAIGTQRMQDEMSFLNSKRDFALREDYLDWDMDKFTQGLEWQTEQSKLDRNLAKEINKNLEDASRDASQYGLFGNIVGSAFDLGGSVVDKWF